MTFYNLMKKIVSEISIFAILFSKFWNQCLAYTQHLLQENIHIAHKYYSENPVDGNGDGQGQIKVISQPIAPWDEYDITTKLEEALSYTNESY